MPAYKQIKEIGNDLGISIHGTTISVTFNITPVGSIGGYLAVVNHAPVKEIERMGTPPPSRGIGRIAIVTKPEISLIILDPVEIRHLFGPSGGLKNGNVLAGCIDQGSRDGGIDFHDEVGYDILARRSTPWHQVGVGPEEETPGAMYFLDIRLLICGNCLLILNFTPFGKFVFHNRLDLVKIIKENMQGIVILEIGKSTIYCIPGPFTTATLIHAGQGSPDPCPIHLVSGAIDYPNYSTHTITDAVLSVG
jgi:hypothetical protein